MAKQPRLRRKESIVPFTNCKIPKGLTAEQVAEIQNSFSIMDANHDGRISKKELITAAFILGMNPTEKEVNQWWATADVNKDGFISLEEYMNMMKSNYVTVDIERARMKAAFSLIDRNGDGFISLDEFRAALMYKDSDITEEEVNELFRQIDIDRDGRIDYTEFVESTLCSKVF